MPKARKSYPCLCCRKRSRTKFARAQHLRVCKALRALKRLRVRLDDDADSRRLDEAADALEEHAGIKRALSFPEFKEYLNRE